MGENNNFVGVIAGTTVDTDMGVNLLIKNNMKAIGYFISKTPQEQTELQALNENELTQKVIYGIKHLKKFKINSIMIYCNSLCGAVDMDKIRKESKIFIVTPLDIYKMIAKKHNRIGLIAANGQSVGNIERTIIKHNPKAKVIGLSNLNIVESVEESHSPIDIIINHSLLEQCRIFIKEDVSLIILGCTHFNYFFKELSEKTRIEVFDPSEKMVEVLKLKNK